jgi:hypothetical protein
MAAAESAHRAIVGAPNAPSATLTTSSTPKRRTGRQSLLSPLPQRTARRCSWIRHQAASSRPERQAAPTLSTPHPQRDAQPHSYPAPKQLRRACTRGEPPRSANETKAPAEIAASWAHQSQRCALSYVNRGQRFSILAVTLLACACPEAPSDYRRRSVVASKSHPRCERPHMPMAPLLLVYR